MLADKRIGETYEEHDQAGCRYVGSNGGNLVQGCKRIWIIGNTSRHSGQAEEMHREESEVHPDKCQPEVELAEGFGVHVPGYFRKPVVPACENGEYGAKRQHIVEVRDHVVSVLQRPVDSRIGEHHTGYAAN